MSTGAEVVHASDQVRLLAGNHTSLTSVTPNNRFHLDLSAR